MVTSLDAMIDLFLIHDHLEVLATIEAAAENLPELNLLWKMRTGKGGLEALSDLPAGHLRLLIVRLNLPDMNGFDFIAQVHKMAPDVYIVPALEGNEGWQVWQRLQEQGLQDVILGTSPVQEMVSVLQSAAPRAKARFNASQGE